VNILSGVTGKVVGSMDRLGRVSTADSGLRAIITRVSKERSVVVPDHSDIVGENKVVEYIQVVPDTDPDYVNALSIYLLREGYEVQ
jgi:hypothetical protein